MEEKSNKKRGEKMRVYNFERRHGVIVAAERCRKDHPEPPHTHKFVELVYTASGTGRHTVDGRTYEVRRGDLIFINYGETHAIESEEETSFFNLLVKPEFLCENLIDGGSVDGVFRLFFSEDGATLRDRERRKVHFSGVERTELEQLIERMQTESSGNRIGRQFVLNGYMRLVFGMLIRALQKEEEPEKKKLSQKAMTAYLDANFTKPLTVASLAAALGYHPAYLGRAFRTLYGMGVKEYLRHRRIAYAADLLTESTASVTDIITAVGYTNRTQFYRDFEEVYGMTPAAYREK